MSVFGGGERSLARWLAGVALLFALLVGLELHGFSISMWRAVVETDPKTRAPASEVLWGEARRIRADVWMAQLPMALAQRSHEPRFPLVNRNVGLGTSVLVPLQGPVAHPLAAFQPRFWGFFAGPDLGMAWMWWSRVLGLFASWMLVFAVVTRGRVALSALGALALVLSPFFQLWSFNAAPLCTYAGLGFVLAATLAGARTPLGIAASALGLGWAGGCFALAVYPPYQVGLASLLLVLFAGFLWDRRGELDLRERAGLRALGLVLAAAIALAAVVLLASEAREAIERLRESAYPGLRVSTGGDRSLWSLFATHLAASVQVQDYGPLGNASEAAGFWLLFPATGAALLWRRAAEGAARDAFALLLLAVCLCAAVYVTVGVPAWLARATLWSRVPGPRAVLVLGLADLLLLVRFLSLEGAREPAEPAAAAARRGRAGWIAGAFGVLVAYAGTRLADVLPELGLGVSLAAWTASVALAYLVVSGAWRRGLALLAAASLLSAGWFNPLVRGGSDYLFENPLSQRILAIDRAAGGETTWLAYGTSWASNLFRVLGVHCLNGIHPVPQLELWRHLDPTGRQREVYDRYANVFFALRREPGAVFQLTRPDAFSVHVSPTAPPLRQLGLTHVLVRTRNTFDFDHTEGLEHLESWRDYHFYRVRP